MWVSVLAPVLGIPAGSGAAVVGAKLGGGVVGVVVEGMTAVVVVPCVVDVDVVVVVTVVVVVGGGVCGRAKVDGGDIAGSGVGGQVDRADDFEPWGWNHVHRVGGSGYAGKRVRRPAELGATPAYPPR